MYFAAQSSIAYIVTSVELILIFFFTSICVASVITPVAAPAITDVLITTLIMIVAENKMLNTLFKLHFIRFPSCKSNFIYYLVRFHIPAILLDAV